MNRGHFTTYAGQQVADARRTLDGHRTVPYTGVCRRCGRPGPCDEQRAARTRFVHFSAARLPWPETLTECWRALGTLHARLAEARTGAPAGSAESMLAGLRAAGVDAERAAALAARVRRQVSAADDLLRRTGGADALVAAGRCAAAVARLDLVAARLAVGARTVDRYAARLAGTPEPAANRRSTRPAVPVEVVAAGVRAAVCLVRDRQRRQGNGRWRTVRDGVAREGRR
ncbi:hypothetical protein ACIBCR_25780 [Micromonospora echinospora]|uniref:hypothetical protein n=1 Tax=Micromonospora echinospora TaxID=1877 RepID=UPI0037AD2067